MRNLVVVAAPHGVVVAGDAAPTALPTWVPLAVGPSKCLSRASPP